MGERLALLMKEKGLTASEFARRVGVSRQAVSFWVTGTYEPSIASLVKIANEFDTTVDWLVGR